MNLNHWLLVIVVFMFSTNVRGQVQSVYSDLSSARCRTIEVDKESGNSVQSCPGVAGYSLLVLDDDLRQSITVVDPRGKKHELNFWHVITGGFSTLGRRAEWRVLKKQRVFVPVALIVRVIANEDPEHPNRSTSYLSVSRIGDSSICVTHRIKGGPQDNELARKAAEETTAPCLKEIPQ